MGYQCIWSMSEVTFTSEDDNSHGVWCLRSRCIGRARGEARVLKEDEMNKKSAYERLDKQCIAREEVLTGKLTSLGLK